MSTGKKISLVGFLTLIVIASVYLSFPSEVFPNPPPDVLISTEPADTETPYRKAYYSNYTRQQIMDHYKKIFNTSIIQYRQNLPPEEAASLIRDQTKSSWLEQLVHPFRAMLFINGFYPTKPTEQINFDGVHYQNKITVRLVPTHLIGRYTAVFLVAVSVYILVKQYVKV